MTTDSNIIQIKNLLLESEAGPESTDPPGPGKAHNGGAKPVSQ